MCLLAALPAPVSERLTSRFRLSFVGDSPTDRKLMTGYSSGWGWVGLGHRCRERGFGFRVRGSGLVALVLGVEHSWTSS